MINLWHRAAVLAAKTPDTRNRSADLFRALSILVVIFGHWLWNFTKCLIDKNGAFLKIFTPTDKPGNIQKEIKKLLS